MSVDRIAFTSTARSAALAAAPAVGVPCRTTALAAALTSGYGGVEPFLLSVAAANGQSVRTVRPLMTNSDHANFAAGGIPAIRLVAGFDDPRIATVGERRKNRDVLEPILDMCYAMAANLTQAEASARFERERVAFAMVLSPAEIVNDPQARAIGMFTEFEHPTVGLARLPRHPTNFHGTPAAPGLSGEPDPAALDAQW